MQMLHMTTGQYTHIAMWLYTHYSSYIQIADDELLLVAAQDHDFLVGKTGKHTHISL